MRYCVACQGGLPAAAVAAHAVLLAAVATVVAAAAGCPPLKCGELGNWIGGSSGGYMRHGMQSVGQQAQAMYVAVQGLRPQEC